MDAGSTASVQDAGNACGDVPLVATAAVFYPQI